LAQQADAGEAQPAADDAPASGLEDIVVTATKRSQNMQSVPVSVTALSSAALEDNRIADVADLTRVAPSLTITQTTSSPNNSIILRGIGTFAFSIGVEPSVAVIIDDMPVAQQAQAFDNMADVERIEVLKGPQGTLFGKSSSAGVINIVTANPGNDFEGRLAFTIASDGDVRTEGMVSVPLGEGAGLRVTGYFHDYPGSVHNLTTGKKLNDQQNYGFRAKLKADLSDRVTLTITAAAASASQDGTATTLRSIEGTGTPRVLGSASLPLLPSLIGITPGSGNYNARVDSLGATKNDTASLSGRVSFDLGSFDLLSITSAQSWKYNFQNDFDGTDIDVLGALTAGAQHGGIAQQGPYQSKVFTQELRLVSTGKGPFKLIGGLFYSRVSTDRGFNRGPVVAVQNWFANNTSKSFGVFAQADYTLPSNTTISGGIRYNRETITVAFDNLLATATANQCAALNPLCRGSNSDEVVTWKASISQEIMPKVMVYGSVATGYKGYAYDITSGFNPARINAALNATGPGLLGVGPVEPETSTSYELGFKSRFLDNRVQFNVIGYLTNYNNFQAQSAILVGTPPAPQFVLNNVGKLRTKGVEVELTVKASDWLRIDAGATYTDATMLSFPQAQGYAGQTGAVWNGTASALVGPCVAAAAATAVNTRTLCTFQDRSGARLPNSPKVKWNIGATADFPIGGNATGTLILGYQHQGSVNYDLLGNPLLVQKPYGVFNASLGGEFGQFKVVFFVNNLFDTHFASSLSDNFGTVGGSATNDTHPIYQFLSRDSQRYGGVTVSARF
jgi:iron complex outermembrane receptor protein